MADFIEKVYSKFNIIPNLPAEIEIQDPDFEGRYKTIIHDYNQKNNTSNIGFPIYKGTYIKLPIGVNIKIRIFSKTSVFLFKSKIIGDGKEGNIRYLTITVPEIIFKVQRRQNVRVNMIKKGHFFIKGEYEELEVPPRYSFITKDFSAGGLSIVSKKVLDDGEDILLNLPLNENLELNMFPCQVVRKIGETDFGEKIYGVRFLELDTKMEKTLVKFVFRYEIEASKKNRNI